MSQGRCFDLTDTEHTNQLAEAFERWKQPYDQNDAEIPQNQSIGGQYDDLVLRFRDCAVINWYLEEVVDTQAEGDYYYQTVRGVFEEGGAAFEGSGIKEKSHAQIAVRDAACILGYFLPTVFFDRGGRDE